MAGPSGRTPKYNWRYPTVDDNVDVPRDVGALAIDVENTVFPGLAGAVPPGCIMMWALANPPTGWLVCLGPSDAAMVAQNPGLDSLFGHNAQNQILLPDYRGMFMLGVGSGHNLGERGGSETAALTNPNQLPAHSHTNSVTNAPTGVAVGAVDINHTHGMTGAADRSLGHSHSLGGNVPLMVGGGWAQATGGTQSTHVPYNNNYTGGSQTGTGGEAAPDHLHATGWMDRSAAHAHPISDPQHKHTVTIDNTGAGASHPNMPPYAAIHYIIKGG